MADPPLTPAAWPQEAIPDADTLLMRVHRNNFPDGQLAPGVFRDIEGSMSTDWIKYSTAEQTRQRARTPAANGVLRLPVGGVRADASPRVEHTPDIARGNRAHADVTGEKSTENRLKLLRLSEWVIPIE